MKNNQNATGRPRLDKGMPDYYITPTRDFTQFTKDCEEKYWSKETAFDWSQNIPDNLKNNLEALPPEAFRHIAFMVLPMILEMIERKTIQVRQDGLPRETDGLKDIATCIPAEKIAIQQALSIPLPLKEMESDLLKLRDQIEIQQFARRELQELQHLGLYKTGNKVKHIETPAEKAEQAQKLVQLKEYITRLQHTYSTQSAALKTERSRLHKQIGQALQAIEPQVLVDLEDTGNLIRRVLTSGQLPTEEQDLSRVKDLILKRQFRALKDIANHALVVEQSAIAPLTMGIIHYKRYREIQEAMTTFINDEAKHSATFRRFLVEKLEAREYISSILIKGANRYMWLARFMPATGMFLAVLVESIGAAYLEFFADEKYMPDKLFRAICKTISTQDEKRHIDLCVAMYNELFREGTRWERTRNLAALKAIMKSVYGDKTDDHHLIQAFRAFGVESDALYRHILERLSQNLTRISVYVEPDKLLQIIGRT